MNAAVTVTNHAPEQRVNGQRIRQGMLYSGRLARPTGRWISGHEVQDLASARDDDQTLDHHALRGNCHHEPVDRDGSRMDLSELRVPGIDDHVRPVYYPSIYSPPMA